MKHILALLVVTASGLIGCAKEETSLERYVRTYAKDVVDNGPRQWFSAGKNLANHRYQIQEQKLAPDNVGGLQVLGKKLLAPGAHLEYTSTLAGSYVFVTTSLITSTVDPVSGATLEEPALSELQASGCLTSDGSSRPPGTGLIYALQRDTLEVAWVRSTASVMRDVAVNPPSNPCGRHFRTAPTVAGNRLIVGTSLTIFGSAFYDGLYVAALDWSQSGRTDWAVQADAQPLANMTASPVVVENKVIIAESLTLAEFVPPELSKRARGRVVALDLNTGRELWPEPFFTVPPCEDPANDDTCFSGGSPWMARLPPVVDVATRTLYLTTGNNYYVPDSVRQCVLSCYSSENDGSRPLTPPQTACVQACQPADNLFNSVLSLDLDSGTLKKSVRFDGYDAYTFDCINLIFSRGPVDPERCPAPAGYNNDFSLAPLRVVARGPEGQERNLIFARQKDSRVRVLDAQTLQEAYPAVVLAEEGYAILDGGGFASDGERVYINYAKHPQTITPGGVVPSADGGSIAAVDPWDGRVLWKHVLPVGSRVNSALTVANGVVYATTFDGRLLGLRAEGRDGASEVLVDVPLSSSSPGIPAISGATVSDGEVFVGDGWGLASFLYRLPTGGTLYKLGLP